MDYKSGDTPKFAPDAIYRISKVLGCSMESLLGEKTPIAPQCWMCNWKEAAGTKEEVDLKTNCIVN